MHFFICFDDIFVRFTAKNRHQLSGTPARLSLRSFTGCIAIIISLEFDILINTHEGGHQLYLALRFDEYSAALDITTK